MKYISGTIALCFSFVLYIYLGGLKLEHSVKYIPEFFVFPTGLLFLSFLFFGLEVKRKRSK